MECHKITIGALVKQQKKQEAFRLIRLPQLSKDQSTDIFPRFYFYFFFSPSHPRAALH